MDPLSKKLFNGAGGQGPVVLMYHSISDDKAWPWAIRYSDFCDQLDLLKANGWKTIRFVDLLDKSTWGPKTVVITFDDGYLDNYAAFEALKARDMCATWFVVSGDVGQARGWDDPGAPPLSLLEGAQLNEMYQAGMEIGSHTRSHARLTELGPDTLRREIIDSRSELADKSGCPIDTFAYPFGAFNDAVVDVVREAGYKAACSTRSGWAMAGGDIMTIRRVTVFNGDSISTFARKLAFLANDVGLGALGRYYGDRIASRLGAKR